MLRKLTISNVLYIDFMSEEFRAGFNVITGETGAGKSIILDCLEFIFGENHFRFSDVRDQNSASFVEAEFTLTAQIRELLDLSFDANETFIIRRIIERNKIRNFINELPVAKETLLALYPFCIEVHSQHAQNKLLDSSIHLSLVDHYGNLIALREDLGFKFQEYKQAQRDLELLQDKSRKRQEDLEYLKNVIDEIEALQPQVGEEEELDTSRKDLQKMEKLSEEVRVILAEFNENKFASSLMQIVKKLSQQKSPEFESITKLLDEALERMFEARDLLENISRQEYDVAKLYSVEERLFAIRDLARKHRISSNDLLEFSQQKKIEYELLDKIEEKTNSLKILLARLEKEYLRLAEDLSKKRLAASSDLASRLKEELKSLALENAIIDIKVTSDIKQISVLGQDDVRIYAAMNPDLSLAPIDKAASGGELSRLALALKLLINRYPSCTMIFDEIDSGVSGGVSEKIAKRLAALSKDSQIFVVTHSAVIAGKADHHYVVRKTYEDSRTSVTFVKLNHESRPLEVARLISGETITQEALITANKFLEGVVYTISHF